MCVRLQYNRTPSKAATYNARQKLYDKGAQKRSTETEHRNGAVTEITSVDPKTEVKRYRDHEFS